jgi:hypothetical protein
LPQMWALNVTRSLGHGLANLGFGSGKFHDTVRKYNIVSTFCFLIVFFKGLTEFRNNIFCVFLGGIGEQHGKFIAPPIALR